VQIIQESKLTSGLTYQILEQQIHRFHITGMNRETVDAVVGHAMAIDKACDAAGQHACFLYVLDGVPFTPYLLHRVIHAVQSTPASLVESTAVVGDNFTLRLFRSLIMTRVADKACQSTQFFSDEAIARTWLLERIAAMTDVE
jgi:hypothetical protein